MASRVSTLRCFLVWASATTVLYGGVFALRPVLGASLSAAGWQGQPLEVLLTRLGAVALAAACAWLWVLVTVTSAEAALSNAQSLGAISPRWTDGWVRRVVLVACGAAFLTGNASAVIAADELPQQPAHSRVESESPRHPVAQASILAGLTLPERAAAPTGHRAASSTKAPPAAAAERPARPHQAAPTSPSATVPPSVHPVQSSQQVQPSHQVQSSHQVQASRQGRPRHRVRPGESLWSIAREHLPPSASDAEVESAWKALYHANRSTIGANPHLIIAGQELWLASLHTTAEDHQEKP